MCGSQWGVRETQKRPHFSHIYQHLFLSHIYALLVENMALSTGNSLDAWLTCLSIEAARVELRKLERPTQCDWLAARKVTKSKLPKAKWGGIEGGGDQPMQCTTKETSILLFRMQVSFLDVAMSRLERVEKRWTGMADVAIFGCQPCWAARDKEKLSQLNLWTNTNKNTEIIFIFCATVAFKGKQL